MRPAPLAEAWVACFDRDALGRCISGAPVVRFYLSNNGTANTVIEASVDAIQGKHLPDSEGNSRFLQYKAINQGRTDMVSLTMADARLAVQNARRPGLEPCAVDVEVSRLQRLLATPNANGIGLHSRMTTDGYGTFEFVPVRVAGHSATAVGGPNDIVVGGSPCPKVCGDPAYYLNSQ